MEIIIKFDCHKNSDEQETSEYEIRRQAAKCINYMDYHFALSEISYLLRTKNEFRINCTITDVDELFDKIQEKFLCILYKYNIDGTDF